MRLAKSAFIGFFVSAEVDSVPHILRFCEHIRNCGSPPGIAFIRIVPALASPLVSLSQVVGRSNRDEYYCSTYDHARDRFQTACSQHYIRTAAVRELVLEAIRSASTYAIKNEAEFIQKVPD